MKTLRLTYQDGRYDIVVENGHSVVLDSSNPADRRTFLQQRFEKCLRSSRNFFDPSYGGEVNTVIGARQSTAVTRIFKMFERMSLFFRKTLAGSGNVGIQGIILNSVTKDGKVRCTVQSASEQVPVEIQNP